MIIGTLKKARLIIISVIGFSVLGMGIVMLVLPGPALVVIPIGLGILSTEFIWARKLLVTVKERIERMKKGY